MELPTAVLNLVEYEYRYPGTKFSTTCTCTSTSCSKASHPSAAGRATPPFYRAGKLKNAMGMDSDAKLQATAVYSYSTLKYSSYMHACLPTRTCAAVLSLVNLVYSCTAVHVQLY